METELTNTTTAVGNYNSIRTAITSTASVVTMVDGLTITKTADKPVWADGDLTYTIVIENEAEKVYEKPVITDILNGTLVKFVTDSVTINGVTATTAEYIYQEDTHTLTVNLDDVQPSSIKTVTFKVSKVS